MNKILCGLVVFLSLASTVSFAEDTYPEFSEKPDRRFDVSKNPYFIHPERALSNLVTSEKKNRATNHFCIVGYEWTGGDHAVWVHWGEGKVLMSWDGSAYQDTRERGLMTSRRSLELEKDTVATADDINGSSYLVTRAWWESVAKDCDAHGEKFTIKPFAVKNK